MPGFSDDYERLIGQDPVRDARALLSAVERTVWLGEAGEASILVRQLSEVRSAAVAEWSDRLVRAAEGEIPSECRPLLTRDLDQRVSSLAGGTA